MPRDRDDRDEQWPVDRLAGSLRSAWHHAAGLPDAPDGGEAGWENAAVVAQAQFAGAGPTGTVELSARELAAVLYHAYRRVEGCRPEHFDDLVPLGRLAWEAVGRHAANLLSADPEELGGEVPALEARWAAWAAAELKTRGLLANGQEKAAR